MEKWRWAVPKVFLAVAAISAFWQWPSEVSAQRPRRPGHPVAGVAAATGDEDDSGPGNFAPPNRDLLQALNRAQKVLQEHRYGEALEGLNLILRSHEDYFYQPDHNLQILKGLKAEAQQLLGQIPAEGRNLYETRYGAEARDRLNRAVAAGDHEGLSDISAQLFHTQAGYEATYLLALYQMDHGAPLAAALTLKRLHEAAGTRYSGSAAEAFEPGLSLTQAACYYQAGMPDNCRQVLVDVKHRLPRLQIAGRDVAWFEQECDAPAWLAKLTGLQPNAAAAETDRWAMFRGTPSRNAATAGGMPLLNLRWRMDVSGSDPLLQKALKDEANRNRELGIALFPGLHPLVVDDRVLMRTTNNVLAIDLATGKAIWPTNDEKEPTETTPNRNMWMARNNMTQQAQYGQRIWDDAAYGTISSDGRLVFVLEELPLGVVQQYNGFVMPGRNDPSGRGITNKLVAYDIHGDGRPQSGGKLQWQQGGPESDDEKLKDAFFLGAPLPLHGQLYVMAEIKDEVRLVALDGATGHVQWQQQLCMVDTNISQDPIRRLAGASPSYADGILICPTGSGCVVAVDLATKSLLWGHIYTHHGEPTAGRRGRGNAFAPGFNNFNGSINAHWLDSSAIIVNGRVLLTPAEADALYCLNLADGKPVWEEKPRKENGEHGEQIDHYYIACVHKGVVVLVGRNSIDAINLEDGSKAWGGRSISIAPGTAVCGHGCYVGGQYFVPIGHHEGGGGEVMAIDLETGKIVATAKSRSGSTSGSTSGTMYPSSWTGAGMPGNLICYRGCVISQGLDGLELYYQADAARAEATRLLAANPNDVKGLTLRGEMLLDAGKSAEAVADFRRAYAQDKSEEHGRTRELLRDALLGGLRDDFATHRSMAAEVEPLLDDSAQRANYYRCMAAGLQGAGDWRQAVEYYLKLVDLEEPKSGLEEIDGSYLVRRDRWVQARLGLLRNEGGAAAAAEIDRAVAPRLEEAKKESGFDGLNRFLGFFGNQPAGAAARAELLLRLVQAGRTMEAELLLASTVDSADRTAQAGLLAEMAELNCRVRSASDNADVRDARLKDAAACFRQLQQQFADVPCLPGVLGARGKEFVVPPLGSRPPESPTKVGTTSGLTPAQWLAALPDGDALRREVAQDTPVWPAGEVEHGQPEITADPNRFNRPGHFDLRFDGGYPFAGGGPFFSDATVSCENQQKVTVRDGLGNVKKTIPLMENGRVFPIFYNQYSTIVRSCGHLLVISAGMKIWGLDPSRKADGSSPAVLWHQDLNDSAAENGGNMVFVNNGMDRGAPANPFGPVNARYVSFQRRRNIVAVDPVSGELLWVRRDIPVGSQVFGDEQYMFVLPPHSDQASVYRGLDGQLLGTRKIPGRQGRAGEDNPNPFANGGQFPQMGWAGNPALANSALSYTGIEFLGRYVLTWEQGRENNGRVLALFDPWLQRAVWRGTCAAGRRNFASGAQVAVVGNEAAGILEPDGHFVLVALADGRTIADLQLAMPSQFIATEFVVARMGDQYIVLLNDNRGQANANEEQTQPPQGMFSLFVRRARLYALDLKGKLVWPAPVDVDRQHFILSQPGRLPVLCFASFHVDNTHPGRMNNNNLQTSLVVIDRRSGNIVYDQGFPGAARQLSLEIRGQPEQKTVQITADTQSVSLTFTDKPAKTTVRHSPGPQKPRRKLGEALLDSVKGAAGGR